MEGRIGDITYVSDIIGIAVQQTDVIPSRNNGDPTRQIHIKNSSDRVAIVTLWGKHAEQFEAETLYQQSVEHNVAILFTGVTVSSFSGMLAFVSTAITRWFFDPILPEAEALHSYFASQHNLIQWDGHNKEADEPSETTLSALGSAHLPDIIVS